MGTFRQTNRTWAMENVSANSIGQHNTFQCVRCYALSSVCMYSKSIVQYAEHWMPTKCAQLSPFAQIITTCTIIITWFLRSSTLQFYELHSLEFCLNSSYFWTPNTSFAEIDVFPPTAVVKNVEKRGMFELSPYFVFLFCPCVCVFACIFYIISRCSSHIICIN